MNLPVVFQRLAVTLFSLTAIPTTRQSIRANSGATSWELYDTGDAANLVTGTVAFARLPMAFARLTGDVSTTLATATDMTGLSFSIGASEIWEFRLHLHATCSSTGGMKLAVNGPSGATLDGGVWGMATGTSVRASEMNALATLSFNQMVAFASSPSDGTIDGQFLVVNSTTAGTVQVQLASFTAGQTSTAKAGSYLIATRLA